MVKGTIDGFPTGLLLHMGSGYGKELGKDGLPLFDLSLSTLGMDPRLDFEKTNGVGRWSSERLPKSFQHSYR